MPRSAFHRPLLAAVMLAMSLFTGAARAENKTELYIQQLKTSEEWRVRTQAALALGASKDDAALQPLCGALDDAHEAVRGAAAAALGKLGKPEGLSCLRAREGSESNDKVKSQIAKAIKTLEAKPAISANAKWYVSIGKTNNKTSRSADEIDALVREALARKLQSNDTFAVAPKGESQSDAKKIIAAKKLKGFELQVTVEPPAYSGDTVSITLRVLITTYPGKDIKAAQSPKISQQGAKANDKALEDTLIRALLEDSVDKFSRNVEAL